MLCKITDFNDHISGNTVGSTLGGTGECRQKQINLSVKFPSARIRRSGRDKSQTVRVFACCSVGPNWDATEAISSISMMILLILLFSLIVFRRSPHRMNLNGRQITCIGAHLFTILE